jgi:hypothetical protein
LLLDAVDVLARNGISYAVIGAMAASVHGVVRASIDADAVLAVPVPELHRLASAAKPALHSKRCWRLGAESLCRGTIVAAPSVWSSLS